jgi:hypothetical protein
LQFLDKIKSLFGIGAPLPPDTRRLAAASENQLSASLQALPIGEKGWISLRDAWHLFFADA